MDNQGDIYLTGLNYTSDTSEGMGSMVLAKYRPGVPSRNYVLAKSAPPEPHLVNINAYSAPLVSLVK
ncbi:MAG: hypothetical protein Q8O90_03280, partial [Elusimicrobiota bacterium]|nr:hypothetical protein [Elusimicrobiota bacterium]